ncbi:transcriptional regulator [Escherichia albertii]|uniref:helix-turn-helix transcriptional regulator n=1 Tax=Escherichia albertii TaxID=208962 RepID=UPI000743EB60|nr:helix-turn-helix transcriptional regulator [Escherichia albertii]
MRTLTPKEIIASLNDTGLTQVDIKNRTGISQASISRIASGKNRDPRFSVVRALEALYQEVTETKKA